MRVGIEAINFYVGSAFIDIRTMFEARGLKLERFDNLMMERKSVGAPCEDPITNGVNAAKPIIDMLSENSKNRIEMVITCSESGVDFGKSISTYIHDYLGLSRTCRLFEVKQACYSATAALQIAASFVLSQVSPGAKVLIISTDVARSSIKNSYAEPSQAEGAVAMLVSDKPRILELDVGATGYYGYEVMDTCRPMPGVEAGDPDLSLLSYLDCLENCYRIYAEKVEGVDFVNTFDYIAFHTPFAGMVKGAHRKMMRGLYKASSEVIEKDFQKRVKPSLAYNTQIGNVYAASLYLALCGLIDNTDLDNIKRVGFFSYGSGCSSEFYSGIVTPNSKDALKKMRITEKLKSRYELSIDEYDSLLDINMQWAFGVKDGEMDYSAFAKMYEHSFRGKGLLALKRVSNYHREYIWS